jgi:membrane dipeptidase
MHNPATSFALDNLVTNPAFSRRTVLAGAMASLGGCAMPDVRQPPPYIDGLSFLPTDMADVVQSKLSAMICDVSEVEEIKDANGAPRYLRTFEANDRALDQAITRIKSDPRIQLGLRGSDIGPGCTAFLQFQSGETIGKDIGNLAHFHAKGLRILQLTHHNNNLLAGGAIEPQHSGLTAFGHEAINELNRLNMLIDVSHGSEATMLETAKASRKPIVYSHGACRAIVDHPRCISDRAIRAIADRGGTIGIFMMSFWLTKDKVPTIDHLLAHLRHVIRVGGAESVAIANDFPMRGQENLLKLGNDNAEGVKEYLGWWRAMRQRGVAGFENDPEHVVIPALNAIKRMEYIHRAMQTAGYSTREIEGALGRNLQRVLRNVLV